MSTCIFCAIAADAAPARRIYEDERTVAFLDIAPATKGHALVVPKEHAADLWSISEEGAEAVAVATVRVARLLRERLPLDGINVMQANGAAAWQEVFHLHAHVVPRYQGDQLQRAWNAVMSTDRELDTIWAELGGAQ